ncbi:hypothetical protein CYMTET_38360 [Cymbomonas tetramitiformis]|uniref:Uncharacterized protein n=1 Tax=Cymbomonas tetramitiformis TaxID=36881 RepID=A0AAE0CC64_9CHLO|nr:hypothetical protein CYMTET_38360 [Cymbomonas tetramitiformis]
MNFLGGAGARSSAPAQPTKPYGQGKPIPDELKHSACFTPSPATAHRSRTKVYIAVSTCAYGLCAGSIREVCDEVIGKHDLDDTTRLYNLMIATDDGTVGFDAKVAQTIYAEYRQFHSTQRLPRQDGVDARQRIATELAKLVGQINATARHVDDNTETKYAIVWLETDAQSVDPYVTFLRALNKHGNTDLTIYGVDVGKALPPGSVSTARPVRSVDKVTLTGDRVRDAREDIIGVPRKLMVTAFT